MTCKDNVSIDNLIYTYLQVLPFFQLVNCPEIHTYDLQFCHTDPNLLNALYRLGLRSE
jgi:hypothetical protein